MSAIKLDLHVHTIYSGDSLITIKDLLKYAKIKGLAGFAITDHNTLKAYHILKKKAQKEQLIIIPGLEIETHIGEVIGYFIDDDFKLKKDEKDFFNIVEKIRDHNGLIVVPHPFDFLRNNHLKMSFLSDKIIKKYINGIEILNSRIIFKSCVKKARKFKNKYHLFETGGSDAHTIKELGNAYTLINDISDFSLESIKKNLLARKSRSLGKLSSPLVHAITVMNKIKKGLYF